MALIDRSFNYNRPGDGRYDVDGATVLLIHSNTSNNSTYIFDVAQAHSVSFVNSAKHDTAQSISQLGPTSITFNGVNQHLSIADHDDYNFGTDDFTLEAWIYPNSGHFSGSYDSYVFGFSVANDNDGSGYSQLNLNFATATGMRTGEWHNPGGGVGTTVYYNTPASASVAASGVVPVNQVWSHVAVVKADDTCMYFLNGVKKAYNTGYRTYLHNCNAALIVGAYQGGGSGYFAGYMTEIRISRGIARWTEDFTVWGAGRVPA